jgi:hypothetical protein
VLKNVYGLPPANNDGGVVPDVNVHVWFATASRRVGPAVRRTTGSIRDEICE